MEAASRHAELEAMLRPPGAGVHVVSTGAREQSELIRRISGVSTVDEVQLTWRGALQRIPEARVVLLGVPSDAGAGFTRGSNRGPEELRRRLLERPGHGAHARDVVDAGDVLVVPQLLDDAMLSADQLAATRMALHGDAASPLPVSPLSVTARALSHVRALAPAAIPIVLGGDHSVGWPAFASAFEATEREGHRVGLLHFDAHTDLLESRLGVRYCFATWAYHANQLLGRDGRLVQVGIRASGREREHWERTLGVRQYWPEELERRDVGAIGDEIVARFERLGVDRLYVSNDIDGTGAEHAAATGTPEPGGPDPATVRALTRRLMERFPLVGADLVEVAPPLAHELAGEPDRTLDVALDYLDDLVAASA